MRLPPFCQVASFSGCVSIFQPQKSSALSCSTACQNDIPAARPISRWGVTFSRCIYPCVSHSLLTGSNSPSFLKMSLSHLQGKKEMLTFYFFCDSLEEHLILMTLWLFKKNQSPDLVSWWQPASILSNGPEGRHSLQWGRVTSGCCLKRKWGFSMIITHQQYSKACFLCIVIYRQKQIPSTDIQNLHWFYDELARCCFLLKKIGGPSIWFLWYQKLNITGFLRNIKAE